jgi:glycerol-3-phosphate acyltransferase PlsY
MSPIAGAIAFFGAFVPIALISRYMSLGSIIAVIAAFLALLVIVLLGHSSATYLLYSGIGGAVIIWQHRDNVQRLLQGKERRLGQLADGTC